MVNARNYLELKRQIVHIMSQHLVQRLTSRRKLLLGGAAAVALVIPLALGMTGFASKGGTHGAEASNGRLPSFKTVSIKLSEGTACCALYLSKDRFVATDSAIDMIIFAYGEKSPLKPVQVLGAPDWVKTEVFNIHAEPSKSLSDQVKTPLSLIGSGPELPGPDVVKQAFRSLLINRFKLRVTHETKVLPVYELVLAKNGPKIAKDETADRSCRITDVGPDLPSVSVRGKGRWLDVRCDFRTFAGVLSAIPELSSRVLLDKTGLHGRYRFKFHWTPEMPPGMPKPAAGGQRNGSAAPSKPSGPSLLTALREQLGLKVQSATAPVDTIVIQHIENPALSVRR
jgi:bla regulator protein blaR1